MTYVAEGPGPRKVVIEAEPDMLCEECGALEETRPYGKGGKRVCFSCGMKDRETVERNLRARLFGEGRII